MFSCSFPSSYLVDAAVVVSVVMLSMYALIGGRRSPALVRSPPTTHFEALMMTSMAIVKAKGETVQPAMMPTSKCCHAVPLVHGKKQKIPTGVHGELNQMHWPGWGRSHVFHVLISCLDLVPDLTCMLRAARKSWNYCFLYRCINVLVSYQIGGQSFWHNAKKVFPSALGWCLMHPFL